MAIGDQLGKQSVDELTHETVPILLAGITANVNTMAGAVKITSDRITDVVIPAFADGISQVLALGNRLDARLDGAEIDIDVMLNGNIPLKGTIKLRCPVGAVS